MKREDFELNNSSNVELFSSVLFGLRLIVLLYHLVLFNLVLLVNSFSKTIESLFWSYISLENTTNNSKGKNLKMTTYYF